MVMKLNKTVYIIVLTLIFSFLNLHSSEAQKNDDYIFKNLEKIELKFGELVFANIGTLFPLKNGFVSYYNESAYGSLYGLVLFSNDGNVIKKYDRRGNGPGEINRISNITVTGNSILVAEFGKPVIHVFDQQLNFVKDYRIKYAGKIYNLGKYVGIWTYNYTNKNNEDKIYVLSLYDSSTFEFQKYAGDVNEVPDFVQYWGGIWQSQKNTFALIFPHHYQVFLYDQHLKLKRKLIKRPPPHIKPFTPWKKNKKHLNNDGMKWIRSWTKPYSLFYYKGKYLLISIYQGDQFLDVIDESGKFLLSGYKLKDYSSINFIKDNFIWIKKTDKEQSKYTLVKTTLVL
jgi:hypothetical protein